MTRRGWLVLLAAIAAEVVGTASLKAAHGFTRPTWVLLAVPAYLVSFWLVARVLAVADLAVTYAVWSGAGTVATAVIGVVVFGEPSGWALPVGVLLVVTGSALLQRGPRAR